MMLEEGYGKGDPKIRLMQLRDALLRAARFVAGIRMHCRGMTKRRPPTLFHEGRQMRAVAEVEARRGTQDPLYIVHLRVSCRSSSCGRTTKRSRAQTTACASSTTRCLATDLRRLR